MMNGNRSFLAVGFCAIGFCALSALSFWRAELVDVAYAQYARCPGCFYPAVLSNDAWILALVFFLAATAHFATSRWLRLPLAFAALAIAFFFALDIIAFKLLSHRLYLYDFLLFGMHTRASWSVVRSLWGSLPDLVLIALGVLAVVSCGLLAWYAKTLPRWLAKFFLAASAVLAVIGVLAPQPQYMHAAAFVNVLALNLPSGVDRGYSASFSERALRAPAMPEYCDKGFGRKLDVLVLAIESLSAYHSKLYSGLWDAMPVLDSIASENYYVPEFFANGFTTDTGLVSIFNGRPPIPAINRYRSIDAFAGYTASAGDFYRFLADAGYQKAFFTSGDLTFLGKDRWAQQAGFDLVEGSESAYYKDDARGQFGAAADERLLSRVAQWVKEERSDRPFFAGILTVATHPPFVHPSTGALDEHGSFSQLDRALGAFVVALRQARYFDGGILIITGDHRSMTPLKQGEYERFGESAYARVPLVVVGPLPQPRGAIQGRFQHTDILPSLQRLIGDKACVDPMHGWFLGEPKRQAQWVVHASGVERDHVKVFYGDKVGDIILAGDGTRWVDAPALPDAGQLVDWVNRDRIARGAARVNLAEKLLEWRQGAESPDQGH